MSPNRNGTTEPPPLNGRWKQLQWGWLHKDDFTCETCKARLESTFIRSRSTYAREWNSGDYARYIERTYGWRKRDFTATESLHNVSLFCLFITYEPEHDKTNWLVRAAKTQISLGLAQIIGVFAVRMKKPWVLSYSLIAQRRLWSDWADARANLSLRWAHRSFCFVVLRFIYYKKDKKGKHYAKRETLCSCHFVSFVMLRLNYCFARGHSSIENFGPCNTLF